MENAQIAGPGENWRENVFTFTDHHGILYTVTNVPDVVKLPRDPGESYLVANATFRQLLSPQYAVNQAPELPYLFRIPPMNDVLLGRLCLESETVYPVRCPDGWCLDLDIRRAWMQLEDGLVLISEKLLLHRNTAESRSLTKCEHWLFPEDFGYTRIHRSSEAATQAIKKSRHALIILAARCSLALAIWHPRSTSPSDDDIIPPWIPFLIKESVPSSWVDALNASVISDFCHGQRVGAIIDPLLCSWLLHVPTMRDAKIPLIVRWGSADRIAELCSQCPSVRDLAPVSKSDIQGALASPERAEAPGIYKLYHNGTGLPHPYVSSVEERLRPKPPCGPFQRPGESRVEFLARTEVRNLQMQSREGPAQKARREDREAYAASGRPPKAYTRVYLWVKASVLGSNVPEKWNDLDYRAEVHRSAAPGLWSEHEEHCRSYNAHFDEWDLWSELAPETRDQEYSHEDNWTFTQAGQDVDSSAARQTLLELFRAESDLLYQQPTASESLPAVFTDAYLKNRYLKDRYGLYPAMIPTISESLDDQVVYHGDRMYDIFGFPKTRSFSFPAEESRTYATWVSTVLGGRTEANVIYNCWDVHSGSPNFLFREDHIGSLVQVVKVQSDKQEGSYIIKYIPDNADLGWALLVNSRVLAFLLRRVPSILSRSDATFELLQVGAPFRTVRAASADEVHIFNSSAPTLLSKPRLMPSYRLDDHAHTSLDYRQYCQRVVDLLRSGPHMRAALLHGGIVWRLVMEFGGSEGTVELMKSYVPWGPSDEIEHHRVYECWRGSQLIDDGLSDEELAVISGVTKVYTHQHNQKEERSWWPKHGVWRTSGMYTGIWNPKNEEWFQRRLLDIQEGREIPLNTRDWRSALGQFRACAKLAKIADEVTTRTVEKHVL